jgi:hypothetical protein
MSNEQISTEMENAGRLNSILEDTESISKDSEITEKFYEIRAIERGGLDVDIVGISSNLKYQERATIYERNNFPTSIYSVEDSKINNLRSADFSFIRKEYDNDEPYCNFHHQCVAFEPSIDVYFRTPFDQIYVANITISKTGES